MSPYKTPRRVLSDAQLLSILASFLYPVSMLTRSGLYAGVLGGTDERYYHDGSGLLGRTLGEVLKAEKATWFLGEIERTLNGRGLHIVEYTLSASDVAGLDDNGPAAPIYFEGRVQPLDILLDGEEMVLWVANNISHPVGIEGQLSDAVRREREAIGILWRRIAASLTPHNDGRWSLDTGAATGR